MNPVANMEEVDGDDDDDDAPTTPMDVSIVIPWLIYNIAPLSARNI